MPEREYYDDPPTYGQDPARNTTQPVAPRVPGPSGRFNDWRNKYPTLSLEDAIRQAYKDFLGREADPEGFAAHLQNPGGLDAVLGTLYDSDEGAAYRAQSASPTTTPTTPAGSGRRGWNNVSLDPRTGGNSGAWSGFNTERASAGGDPNSIKDAFYRFGQGFTFDPRGQSKDAIDAFLTSQIEAAKEYGIDILDVNGDQILVRTAENPEGTWVDVVQNAGGEGDAPWQWLDQSYMDVPSANAGGGGGGGGGTSGIGSSPDALMQAILQMIGSPQMGGGSNVIDQILAELQAQAQGRGSPMARQSLLQQLQR